MQWKLTTSFRGAEAERLHAKLTKTPPAHNAGGVFTERNQLFDAHHATRPTAQQIS